MSDEHGDGPPELVLGPDEIINYPLRKATRGYQVKEVDDLLDQLAVQTQDLLARIDRLEDEREQLGAQLAEASETESMLKKTLVTAQRAAEASVAEAREEADELRQRARERVEEMLASAAEQAHELREAALRRARADEADVRRYRRDVEEHIDALRTFAADHRARLAHHLEQQQARLDEMELPDAPPEPELVDDEIIDAEVEEVDVQGMVAELTAERPDDSPDSSPDESPSDDAADEGLEPVDETADGSADEPDGESAPVDAEESLFDR